MKKYTEWVEQQEKLREEQFKEKDKWMKEWMAWMADTVIRDRDEKEWAEEILML